MRVEPALLTATLLTRRVNNRTVLAINSLTMRYHSTAFQPSMFCVLLLACVALATSGCNKGPRMYQVSGKVLYKDGSVPKAPVALVRFEPTQNSTAEIRKTATGEIGQDG